MLTQDHNAPGERPPLEHFDVLIVGAGLSGIGAASHLQAQLPEKTYAILEARDVIGGTWDLFRYPGVRSDSDMHTLSYRFRPWGEDQAIADGRSILNYVRETASQHGVDRSIRFNHRVVAAEWSTHEARWTVEAERTDTGEPVQLSCGFLFSCCGYYRYDEGYTPAFEGTDRFDGPIVHPQHWPEDLDYTNKRVVVIGSGATAVTLVPAMAEHAAHVTMLQRSPSYIVSLPAADRFANRMRRLLPARVAGSVSRWKNVLRALLFYQLSRRRPEVVKRILREALERQLPAGYDVDPHFTPDYNPWDQRLCLVPDGDLFSAISKGRASVVTDQIETFTERGIKLRSGAELEADLIITATGLNLLPFGGIRLIVDGEQIELSETMGYKGMMLSGVPNFAYAIGYTNASWTLKVDLVCEYLCRLLKHMDQQGARQCLPERDSSVSEHPFMDLTSGYVLRSIDQFPKQGAKAPWRLRQNYASDLLALRYGRVADSWLKLSSPEPSTARTTTVAT